MELPSNKVGFVLIFVVLAVSSTVFFSKVQRNGSGELQNVDLTIARNTDAADATLDTDGDGLSNWEETLYKSNPDVADTDGDGTDDGAEVSADRNPAVAGPDDPLVMASELFATDFDLRGYATGTPTDQMSIDLLAQYLNLKKTNSLTAEKQEEIVTQIAQNTVKNVDFKDHFAISDLNIINSNPDTVQAYGTAFAKTSLAHLTTLDSYKNLSDSQYVSQITAAYQDYALDMAALEVPDVAKEVHLQIVNRIYGTADLMEFLARADNDPVSVMVAIGVQQAKGSDTYLYTSLATYFRNNDILFDDTTAARFWKYYEN